MPAHNEKLIQDAESLRKGRVIRYDSEIADRTGYGRPQVSNYLSGNVKASEPFLKKFYEVFKKELFVNNVSSAEFPVSSKTHNTQNTDTMGNKELEIKSLKIFIEQQSRVIAALTTQLELNQLTLKKYEAKISEIETGKPKRKDNMW